MQKFGWILSFILLIGFTYAYACPINSSTISSEMEVANGTCSNQIILLYNLVDSVDSLIVTGNLTIVNSTLTFAKGSSRSLNISGKGDFNLINSSINSSDGDLFNFTIVSNEGGSLSFDDLRMFDVDDFRLYNVNSTLGLNGFLMVGYDDVSNSQITIDTSEDILINNSVVEIDDFVIDLSENITLFNLTLNQSNGGFRVLDSKDIFLDDIKGNGNYLMTVQNSTLNSYGRSSVLDLDFNIGQNSTVSFYDSDYNYSLLDISEVNVFYGINFVVKRYLIGTVINLAKVDIFDIYNLTKSYDLGYSDYDGEYFSYLRSFRENLTKTTYYSNYSVNVSKERYLPNYFEYNVTESKTVNVFLKSDKGIVKQSPFCIDSGSNFCVDQNPAHTSNCFDMVPGDTCYVDFEINATDNGASRGSLTLNNTNFTFFMISESNLPEVKSVESDSFDMRVFVE